MRRFVFVAGAVAALALMTSVSFGESIPMEPGGVPAYVPDWDNYQGAMLFDDNSGTAFSVARVSGKATGVVLPSALKLSSSDLAVWGGAMAYTRMDASGKVPRTFDLSWGAGEAPSDIHVDLTGVLSRMRLTDIEVAPGAQVHYTGSGAIDWIGFGTSDTLRLSVTYQGAELGLWADLPGLPGAGTDYDHNQFLPRAGFDPTQPVNVPNAVLPSGEVAKANDGKLWLSGDVSQVTGDLLFRRRVVGGREQVTMSASLGGVFHATGGEMLAAVPDDGYFTTDLYSTLGAIGGQGFLPDARFIGGAGNEYDPALDSGLPWGAGFELGQVPSLTIHVVPEPTTMLLLAGALVGLALRRRK